jgi:cold shock protein
MNRLQVGYTAFQPLDRRQPSLDVHRLHLPERPADRYEFPSVGLLRADDPDDTTRGDGILSSSKNDRQRPQRRRGYDDNLFGNTPEPVSFPSFGANPSLPEVEATVNWFNATKGFGFVALADGSGDVFLHVSVLQAVGYKDVNPGATLKVRVGNGQKGRQVEQIISIANSTAEPPSRRQPQSGRDPKPDRPRRQVDPSTAIEMAGTVKWYNPNKGFGFISPEGGGKDVFVHATALERSGLTTLDDGQTVRIGVVQGTKGPEAATVRLG